MTDAGSAALGLTSALALLIVPGGALAHALGFRGLWWLASSPVFSTAVIAATGVVAAPLGVRFAWWEPTAVAAVASAAVVGVRAARKRPLLPVVLGRWSSREAALLAVVILSAAVVGGIAANGIGSWDHISQTYDGVFHLNAVAWIQSTGDASSFDLYRITHPGDGNQFYPAAWHDLVVSTVQLTGASIPVATNATWFAAQGVIWVPGIALLGATVANPRWRRVAAGVSSLASIGLIGFPDLLLAWGTLYPNALAYALLPFGLALSLRMLRWIRRAVSGAHPRLPGATLAGLAIWLIASGLAHPRSLVSFAVVATPPIAWELVRAVRVLWARPHLRRRLVVVGVACAVGILSVAAVGVIYVYRNYLVYRPIADHLNGGPAIAHQGISASLVQALTLAPIDPTLSTPLPASWALAALVLLGLGVGSVIPRTRWLVVAWIVVVVLYVCAAGSNSDLAKVLTGLWYKDKFRLFSILPLLQAPLIALGITGTLSRLVGRARLLGSAAAAVVVAVAVLTSNGVLVAPSMIRSVFALPIHDKGGRIIDADEQKLLEELPSYVPSEDVIAGDPWDGSTLSWAIGNRRTLFPHLAGVWSADELLVASRLDDVLTDSRVCAAVKRLDLKWVVEDPQLLWGHPVEADLFVGFHHAVQRKILAPVVRVGSAGLYRIPACQ